MLSTMVDPFDSLERAVSARVSLRPADADLLRLSFQRVDVARRGYYLRPGETCSRIGFLAAGCLAASESNGRGEVTVHIFIEDSFVADYYSYLTVTPSVQSIRAIEDSALLVADRQAIDRLYDAVPSWERLGRLIAEEVYMCAHVRTASLMHDSAEDRYAKFVNDRPELVARLPQHVVASYIGVTPETLSRIRGRSKQ